MKRLTDMLAVLLLAVMLSACGKEPEETHAGQTEKLELT